MRGITLLIIVLCACQKIEASDKWSDTSAPSWMRHAIIYGIKPSGFVDSSSYEKITEKLPEIQELGINTIWLQPVFKTKAGGQGYDIIDFFTLRDDLGTEAGLKELIRRSHELNMKVLFDFVPNHTSIYHPYAMDVAKNGKNSAYYDYYQHEKDGAPYSSYYHKDSSGFIYYFWKNLVNLNYNSEKVRKMITDACVYWIREFDIDGYRFDAVWAVNARAPQFGNELRKALKAVKPDVLLLAEDKGSDPEVYRQGFDAAYDWTTDTSWVSHWPWQYEHHNRENHTVFNHPKISERKFLLAQALFSNKTNNNRILRFMENNDIPRFAATHSLEQTKMAAALLFALPGIPLVYNGQETGVKSHPYSRRPVYSAAHTIREQDSAGLYSWYHTLISERLKHPSLTSANIEEANIVNEAPAVAFWRRQGKENVLVVINLDSVYTEVKIHTGPGRRMYYNILNGERWVSGRKGEVLNIKMKGYSTSWLLVQKKS